MAGHSKTLPEPEFFDTFITIPSTVPLLHSPAINVASYRHTETHPDDGILKGYCLDTGAAKSVIVMRQYKALCKTFQQKT